MTISYQIGDILNIPFDGGRLVGRIRGIDTKRSGHDCVRVLVEEIGGTRRKTTVSIPVPVVIQDPVKP